MTLQDLNLGPAGYRPSDLTIMARLLPKLLTIFGSCWQKPDRCDILATTAESFFIIRGIVFQRVSLV